MKRIPASLILLIFAVTGLLAFTQNSASKLADVQVKLMKMDSKYYIFLTDASDAPFSNKNITVSGKSDAAEGLTFTAFGNNAFLLNKDISSFTKLSLTFHLKEVNHNEYVYAKITNKHQDETVYTCPMDAGEMFKSGGKCPKCGMSLAAKQTTVFDPATVVRKGSK